jgi:hypothetical protein
MSLQLPRWSKKRRGSTWLKTSILRMTFLGETGGWRQPGGKSRRHRMVAGNTGRVDRLYKIADRRSEAFVFPGVEWLMRRSASGSDRPGGANSDPLLPIRGE